MTNKSRMDFRWISIAGQARDRTRCRSRDVAMRSSGSTSDGLLLVGGNDRREDRDRPLGGGRTQVFVVTRRKGNPSSLRQFC